MKKNTIYYNKKLYYTLINNNMGGNNMANFMDIQFSIFGDFREIKATHENIMELMIGLGSFKLLPTTVVNQNINIDTNEIESENRISFISMDQVFKIVIDSERVDFTYDLKQIEKSDDSTFINEKFTYFNEVYLKLFEILEIKGNRLAINVTLLGDKSIDNSVTEYFNQNIRPFNFYSNKKISDWNYSTTGKSSININNNEEELNIITSLSTITNINSSEKRLLCHFDINTIKESTSNRFINKDINDFLDNLKPILEELIKDFKACDNNE